MPDQGYQRLRVDVERLTRRMGKYALVIAVSQRARQLKERQTHLADLSPTDIVGRALNEISEAKVKLVKDAEQP